MAYSPARSKALKPPLQPPRKPLQFLFDLRQNSLVPPSPLPPWSPHLPLHLCLCPCGSPSLAPPPTSAARPTPASAPHLCSLLLALSSAGKHSRMGGSRQWCVAVGGSGRCGPTMANVAGRPQTRTIAEPKQRQSNAERNETIRTKSEPPPQTIFYGKFRWWSKLNHPWRGHYGTKVVAL